MTINTPKKNYLFLAIFIFLSIILIIFGVFPLFKEIRKSSQEIVSQKQQLFALAAKIENLEKFKIIYQNLKPSLEKINALFVDSEVPVEFIRFLEKTSQESQILIEISPAMPIKTDKDYWPSIAFQIISTGSFPNFLRFFEKLETSPYLIEIQNLNIAEVNEENLGLKNIEAVFIIKVFTR